jgi:spermidine synthase
LLFAGSGCAALIYEVVWFQLLQLAIGSTSVSVGILLAAYMGGLCIGSLGFAKVRSRWKHPLRAYAALEAGIGVLGLVTLVLIPLIGKIYFAWAGYGVMDMITRGVIAAICLLPPTILMGASLPAIAQWTESTPRGASWWGLLYGGNTAGAVVGCMLAGFYLLREYNTIVATLAAVAINLVVALASYHLASRTPARAGEEGEEEAAPADAETGALWPVYVTIALSGASALGAEVVWTRTLGMLMGATTYVFSVILAVFLVGLALGSWLGSWMLRAFRPKSALGWSQMLLVGGIAWAAWMLSDSLPFWPINPMLSTNAWHIVQLDIVRTLWAVLPATLMWGASFPLACAAVSKRGEDAGRLVGRVYAANTVGSILGALAVSLVLMPWVGTQNCERLLLVLAAVAAAVVLAGEVSRAKTAFQGTVLVAALILAVLLVRGVHPIPGKLIAYGRKMAVSSGEVVYTKEGRNSSVAITQWPDGAVEVDVNGHVEATTEPYDMKLQRSVGHMPALLHPNPKSVLGIGFGAGVSAGTFTTYPGIEKITICEIEPVIPPTSTRYFGKQDYNVFLNPKTHMVFDDARHFLMTTKEKFDIIASDPLDVFAKGTAALYSKEYFEAVKAHLNPGGYFSLYVPLYESDERTVRSEIATFLDVFPQGSLWANTVDGHGYDMVFLGQVGPLKVDLDAMQARLERPDYAPVAQSLREISVYSAADIFANYSGRKTDLAPWIGDAEINKDRNLRLQYLAGWGINSSFEDYLYGKMMQYRKAPTDIFTGSPDRVRAVLATAGQP